MPGKPQRSPSRTAADPCLLAVTQEVHDMTVLCSYEEAADAPRLGCERVDDLLPATNGFGVGLIDIVNGDRDGWGIGRSAVSSEQL
ncbi:hypothetical protein GCM10025789_07940 [Tessaracoccus lubricantis]|uniref:Uncharacterized protein n=1 Tax=Tessaracoccus lubricantis TaxID=545543 RepID=A0ABP9F4W4_9ACTN